MVPALPPLRYVTHFAGVAESNQGAVRHDDPEQLVHPSGLVEVVVADVGHFALRVQQDRPAVAELAGGVDHLVLLGDGHGLVRDKWEGATPAQPAVLGLGLDIGEMSKVGVGRDAHDLAVHLTELVDPAGELGDLVGAHHGEVVRVEEHQDELFPKGREVEADDLAGDHSGCHDVGSLVARCQKIFLRLLLPPVSAWSDGRTERGACHGRTDHFFAQEINLWSLFSKHKASNNHIPSYFF